MSTQERTYAWADTPVAPSPMSLGYRVGMAVVAIAMILLPLIYILLCLSVASGIYFYATNEYGLIEYKQPGIVAYLGPIVAGGIGLVFMVKPLFSSQKKINAHLIITRETQPELFQFIEEVCMRVRAPKPIRILLDNQANASASFEHGWWGVLTNRLVLTIGMPLAQGLTVQQFGGVLAHEFGHFTQAAAMRFSYLIRTTNGWFGRVIYERDSLDARLTAWSKRGNIYWLIMANIAVGFVWVARKILWVLMRAGHAVSAYMMRQMEYDADHYEKEIAGVKDFKETFLRLHLINAGVQMSGNHLGQLWKDGRLVDNLPLLTRHLTETIPDQAVQSLQASFETDRTSAKWYATHPSDYQRITRPTSASETGILTGNEPATTLFADFEKVSESLTLIDYKERFNLKLNPNTLISTSTYLSENSAKIDRRKNMAAFFGGLLSDHCLLFPENPHPEETLTLDGVRAYYKSYANDLEEHKPAITATCEKMDTARTRRAKAMAAQALVVIGVPIKAANFDLKNTSAKTIAHTIDESSDEISKLKPDLSPLIQIAQGKLYYLCQLGDHAEWLARIENSPDWLKWTESITELKNFLISVQPISSILLEQRKSFFVAAIYIENFKASKNKKKTEARFETLATQFRESLSKIEKLATQIPYPLQDGKIYHHLTGYFVTGNNQPGAVGHYLYLRSLFERFDHAYTEVMMELLEKLSAVENALQPEPSPIPEE